MVRRQLTLFVDIIAAKSIEDIRKKFNPLQFALIPAHVTLCREGECENMEKIKANILHLRPKKITMQFGQPARINGGAGVIMKSKCGEEDFHLLRNMILYGITKNISHLEPHITLVHARNGVCTDTIWEQIQNYNLPTTFQFNTISHIEQVDGGDWKVLESFELYY